MTTSGFQAGLSRTAAIYAHRSESPLPALRDGAGLQAHPISHLQRKLTLFGLIRPRHSAQKMSASRCPAGPTNETLGGLRAGPVRQICIYDAPASSFSILEEIVSDAASNAAPER